MREINQIVIHCSDVARTEEWRNIPGYSAYSVSSHGRIRRAAAGKGTRAGLILKPRAGKKCGHLYVNLHANGRQKSYYVHRLVALAFLGEPPSERHQVAHWDGNSGNNHVANLRWATPGENSADSIRLGRSGRPAGINSKAAKLNMAEMEQVLLLHAVGKSQREIARKINVSHSTVGMFLRGGSYKAERAMLCAK